jgi:hypothetical protein
MAFWCAGAANYGRIFEEGNLMRFISYFLSFTISDKF